MSRLKNHLIGRPIGVSVITIIIFSVAVESINPYTKLSVEGFSSVTSKLQTSQALLPLIIKQSKPTSIPR